jgi:hypothetical protein
MIMLNFFPSFSHYAAYLCLAGSLVIHFYSCGESKRPSQQDILTCLAEGFEKGKNIEQCHENCKKHHLYCGAVWRSDEWPVKTCWQECAYLADKDELVLE